MKVISPLLAGTGVFAADAGNGFSCFGLLFLEPNIPPLCLKDRSISLGYKMC